MNLGIGYARRKPPQEDESTLASLLKMAGALVGLVAVTGLGIGIAAGSVALLEAAATPALRGIDAHYEAQRKAQRQAEACQELAQNAPNWLDLEECQ